MGEVICGVSLLANAVGGGRKHQQIGVSTGAVHARFMG